MQEKQNIYTIPPSPRERKKLREQLGPFVSRFAVVPPLPLAMLSQWAEQFIAEQALDSGYKGWLMVEIHNQIWRPTMASIPYEKRLLLLPQCLRHADTCQATIDEISLVCHQCQHCTIPDLQEKADALGMMSLVAEGFTSVVGLIEQGIVEAVIGVSCLESLEKAFPLLIDHAIAGLAVPLNKNGCKDTHVDTDYMVQLMEAHTEDAPPSLDYDSLKLDVRSWFYADTLRASVLSSDDPTSVVAMKWLCGSGKRWRPFLLTATHQALCGLATVPDLVTQAAIAVECFHKASLVHDDIQDNDLLRYGAPTVYAEQGIPMAINVGDLLLGEGYRILAQCPKKGLVRVAAEAHAALCRGQGLELAWSRSPRPLTWDFVLDIIALKTVPAFEVSLMMGVLCAGQEALLGDSLRQYARCVGIAYQLLDDIADFQPRAGNSQSDVADSQSGTPDNQSGTAIALRPSAVLAVLCEQYATERSFIEQLLHTHNIKLFLNQKPYKARLDAAIEQVRTQAATYRQAAFEALQPIQIVALKRLLFRITSKIVQDS